MKILITGCAGYVGSILTKYLLDNTDYEVVGMDNFVYKNYYTSLGSNPHCEMSVKWSWLHNYYHKFSFIEQDITKIENWSEALKDIDIIIPLAALVGMPICNQKPEEAQAINYDAIVHIMQAVTTQRVIFPMTNSGYGANTANLQEFIEEDPLTPISLYGRTKCEAEQAVLQHNNTVSLRFATVFGVSPRMRYDLLVNDFTSQVLLNNKLVLYEPHFVRNYIHVLDACRAIHHFVECSNTGVFNCGNPNLNLSKIDLAEKIVCTLQQYNARISIGQGRDPDQRNYRVSNEKILSTGFKFRIPLEQGINEIKERMPPNKEYSRKIVKKSRNC